MLAQDIGCPVVFPQERCSGSYTRRRKNRWAIKGLARAREVYETSGLDPSRRGIEVLKTTKEALRAVPDQGVGFGALGYLQESDCLPQEPATCFNYLGKFTAGSDPEQSVCVSSRVALAQQGTRPADQRRQFRMDVLAMQQGVDLTVNFICDEAFYSELALARLYLRWPVYATIFNIICPR